MRRDALIKIGWAEDKGERGPASWDHGASYVHDRGRPIDLHQIERAALFLRNFLIKIDVLLCKRNS